MHSQNLVSRSVPEESIPCGQPSQFSLIFLGLWAATTFESHQRFSVGLDSLEVIVTATLKSSRTSSETKSCRPWGVLGNTGLLEGPMLFNLQLPSDSMIFPLKIYWHMIGSILSFTWCRFTVPEANQPHSISKPLPCFTLGTVFFTVYISFFLLQTCHWLSINFQFCFIAPQSRIHKSL